MATTGVSSKNVFIGAPDQATTGAILTAPLGTALPTSVATALNAAFVDTGYISEDGLKVTPDRSIEGIKDWSGATIRRVLKEFQNTLAWQHIETSTAALTNYFGELNIATVAATIPAGNLQTLKLNALDLPRKSWVFKIKDDIRKVLIVAPDAQVTKQEAIEFKQANAIGWGLELSTYPDANGNHLYIYTDDGLHL